MGARIRELAELKFIEDNQVAVFLGPPGVGKTHLALAIGVLADVFLKKGTERETLDH